MVPPQRAASRLALATYSSSGRFREILQSVTGLLAPECTATLLPSVDGTGRGAAMVTAVALRLAAQRHQVDQVLAPLRLSRVDLERIQALMRQEMELGLGRETNANSSVRMLPSYVRGTPDGTGEGCAPGEGGDGETVAPLMPHTGCHRARRFPGVGPGGDEFPGAGGAIGRGWHRNGQRDLRHPNHHHARHRRGGEAKDPPPSDRATVSPPSLPTGLGWGQETPMHCPSLGPETVADFHSSSTTSSSASWTSS